MERLYKKYSRTFLFLSPPLVLLVCFLFVVSLAVVLLCGEPNLWVEVDDHPIPPTLNHLPIILYFSSIVSLSSNHNACTT